MKTDVISIYSDLKGREEALDAADRFLSYNNISGKAAKHIRLLTEEAVCLVHGIMDGFRGDIWLESEKADDKILCRICITAQSSVTGYQEDQLLSVATSGRNEEAKGILGKIRELIRLSTQRPAAFEESNEDFDDWYYMGAPHGESRMIDDYYIGYWSLDSYRTSLENKQSEAPRMEEQDELERSIIASLADDVKIWIKRDTTKVVIEKKV